MRPTTATMATAASASVTLRYLRIAKSRLMKRPGILYPSGATADPSKYGAAFSQSFTPQKPGWRAMRRGASRRMMGALNSSIMTMSQKMPSASVNPKPLTDAEARKNSVSADTSVTRSASIEVRMP